MPGQGIIGSAAGQAESLGNLAGAPGPREQLGRLDLGPELGADDSQQHDGRGLLAPLLVGRGHLLGLREAGEAACVGRKSRGGGAFNIPNSVFQRVKK